MNTIINKLYLINKGGSLSSNECQKINAELSSLNAEDIPFEQHENVKDYLASVLNHDSVEPKLIPKLDKLLNDRQQIA